MLFDPANVGEIVSRVRNSDDPVVAFRWFRRVLLLKGAYWHLDIISIDGDVIRKALRASAAIPAKELSKVANSSNRAYRSLPAFVSACLLVTNRVDKGARRKVPVKYNNCHDNFQKAFAYISEKVIPSSLLQAHLIISYKNYVTIILRAAGYSDFALEIGRQVTLFTMMVRAKLDDNRFRAFTDRWTISIGHIVIMAYLVKAQEAGLTDYRGIKIWTGIVANRYLLDRVTALTSNFEFVRPRSTFGDNHSVNHPEFFEGAYRNHFDTCGVIADRLGDETGAIMPRPTLSEPPLKEFLDAAGLRPTDRIVTIHCREPGFRVDRRHDMRNVDIATYLPAIRMLAERGFKIVRLGDRSMTRLPAIPGVFDYATSKLKSPELDVLLPGVAEFHIGSSSGLSLVPMLFGTPCLYLNWYPLDMMPWGRRNWTVLRPMLTIDGSEPVTDPATYFKFGRMADRTLLRACGFEPVNLTEDQIARAVSMFVDHLDSRHDEPARTGRNIGPVLIASPHDDPAALVPVPNSYLAGDEAALPAPDPV